MKNVNWGQRAVSVVISMYYSSSRPEFDSQYVCQATDNYLGI